MKHVYEKHRLRRHVSPVKLLLSFRNVFASWKQSLIENAARIALHFHALTASSKMRLNVRPQNAVFLDIYDFTDTSFMGKASHNFQRPNASPNIGNPSLWVIVSYGFQIIFLNGTLFRTLLLAHAERNTPNSTH